MGVAGGGYWGIWCVEVLALGGSAVTPSVTSVTDFGGIVDVPGCQRLFSDNRHTYHAHLTKPFVAERFRPSSTDGTINISSPTPAYQRHCR